MTERRKYKNPPILEAVCEIRFMPDQKWDFTVPGILYEKIKAEFPEKESVSFPRGNSAQGELAVFRSRKNNTMVRVGTKIPILSIIQQKPYSTWHEFRPKIANAYSELRAIDGVEIKGVQRIGLLYVNLIEIPKKSVNLVDYFKYGLNLGDSLPKDPRTFLVGSDFSFFEGRDVCRVQLASAKPSRDELFAVRLDLDYYLSKPQAVSPEGVLEWVETAHQKVEEIFEGCITDRARELFEKVK